jgi:hypothetical protein
MATGVTVCVLCVCVCVCVATQQQYTHRETHRRNNLRASQRRCAGGKWAVGKSACDRAQWKTSLSVLSLSHSASGGS